MVDIFFFRLLRGDGDVLESSEMSFLDPARELRGEQDKGTSVKGSEAGAKEMEEEGGDTIEQSLPVSTELPSAVMESW